MKKGKRLLSVCIALALNNTVYAEDVSDHNKVCLQKSSGQVQANDKQSADCALAAPSDERWGWALGGVAVLVAGVAIGVENNHSSDRHHGNDVIPPAPAPDDDGNVNPPTPVPPDDGGDVTPPAPVPPDGGGDVDPPTPPDTSTTRYNNGVTLNREQKTVTFDTVTLDDQRWNNVTFSYVEDGQHYFLTAPDGRTLVIDRKYVTGADNTIMEGSQGSTGYYWKYDSQGKFWFATADTTVIKGDNQPNVIDTDTVASGADNIGTLISGDGMQNTLNGDITASDGAIGTVVSGDNTTTTLNGDIYASGGATGLYVSGNDTIVSNNGTITAVDASSTGVVVSGTSTHFSNSGTIDSSLNGTGVSITGNDATVMLDGEVNVHAEVGANGAYQEATGVAVTGDNGNTRITGDVNITGQKDANNAVVPEGTLTGVSVSGTNNTITLDGAVNISLDDPKDHDQNGFTAAGIAVTGSDNTVDIDGGINITTSSVDTTSNDTTKSHNAYGVTINGNNTVTVSGHSTIDLTGAPGAATGLATVTKGGHLLLDTDSVVNVAFESASTWGVAEDATIVASDAGSSAENQGVMNGVGSALMLAENGATVSNSGQIIITPIQDTSKLSWSGIIRATGKNSLAVNKSGGEIKVTSTSAPASTGGVSILPLKWYGMNNYALLASWYGAVENQSGATIDLQGAGLYGVAASLGTALNAGTINVDGFVPTLDADGNVTGKTFWQSSGKLYLMSAGVITGSTDQGNGDATGLNTGTINVNNEGFGMLALNGGTVTNQGTINLTADAGVSKSADNQLIAMGAMKGGTAINDQSGVININADYGQAFYNDGSGSIVNRGQINLNGSAMPADDSHMGSQPTTQSVLNNVITGSGETLELDSATGFLSPGTGGANYGSATLNGDLQTKNWLWNKGADSVLTVNGNVNVAQGLENQGTLTAATVTTSGSTYNRSDASMTVDTLTAPKFFNEGTFTGTAQASSYADNLVNTGTMTVAQDGRAVFIGASNIYNQAGATITNTAQATTGGDNALIYITRTSGAATTLVNSGSLLAQNGYSAIITKDTATNDGHQWFINTETGVIRGTTPDSALVQIGKGYSFANQGTISVQGDNAVAIRGANTSTPLNLVNSGTLNVGTAEGKADGTNGTGLVGIQSGGAGNVINNTADGVINVYADDSYAFGGTTGRIINNGEVNLLCDTGCGLYAPSYTGTQDDHDGTADISVPAASKAPAQGSVPDAPADTTAGLQTVSDYTIGTNADGSAGVLRASNVQLSDVTVDTGFTAGTGATTMTFDNVVTGSNIQGADAITSTSVVWSAQGSNDADGNVDVTMTKNSYADVATDSDVNSVASVLDNGYTNNELYNSLNVRTTAELNNALKQISGSQATSVFNEARMLSNRFDMLTDAAPVLGNGLAMNLVAKGDPRAELGKDTKYDMLALRQKLSLTDSQSLSLEYGIARLDGDDSTLAGDNSITGGYSQFFGLKYEMAFDNGLSWNNALRYDVHNLDSNRAVSYNNVSKSADSNMRQQYLELRSSGAKRFALSETLTVTPYAGVKLRHTLEDGYQERNAGDFNLKMNAGSETAVDGIAGLKLDYAGKNGWGATATLEGGPNLSYAKSQRSATLAGAGSERFNVDDGQKGGGMNSLATVGVKYSGKESALQMEAFHWQEDGISDKGLMMSYKVHF